MIDEKELVKVVPSSRQLLYQQIEFYAFVHFTVNTFTGLEWGDGTEPESVFYPSKMNARQWVESIKKAGMKGLILTCKHHDGFCLWPSKYTDHTIAKSPYKDGKGDIVREVADACREAGVHEDTITITFREKKTINYLVMKENIRMSQRIEKFSVLDDQDQVIYRGTIVGYKKIIPLNGMETARIRIQIEESRVCPTLSFIGVYC